MARRVASGFVRVLEREARADQRVALESVPVWAQEEPVALPAASAFYQAPVPDAPEFRVITPPGPTARITLRRLRSTRRAQPSAPPLSHIPPTALRRSPVTPRPGIPRMS